MGRADFVTIEEITSQTAAWAQAIDLAAAAAPAISALDVASCRQILCVGCGSTYYLALSVASLMQARTGVIARAFPSSELLLNPGSVYVEGKTLLVAFSRSGATSETVRAIAEFKANHKGTVIVVTNYGDSPMAKQGDIVITIARGQETSVAQTRSFASMHVAGAAIADLLGPHAPGSAYRDALVDQGNRLLRDSAGLAQALGRDRGIRRVFFLGSGPRHGLANEVSLKLKEMSQTVSEPFHFFEFRHGPREKGTDIEWKSGIAEHVRNVLYLPALQLFAYNRSVHLGKNPDKPLHLTAVVQLDFGA
jgi:glucosamine--fructose-6-phosphate aminotransferase (isomerizing)